MNNYIQIIFTIFIIYLLLHKILIYPNKFNIIYSNFLNYLIVTIILFLFSGKHFMTAFFVFLTYIIVKFLDIIVDE